MRSPGRFRHRPPHQPVRPVRFDSAWQRRRGWRARWRRWRRIGRPFLLLGLLLGGWLFVEDRLRPAVQWNASDARFELCGAGPNSACVIDGDTVRYGHLATDRRVRFTGFDAPEMDGACPAEREKAQAAKRALHAWLAQGPLEWSGGTDPPRDRYGRELREARRGDDLLADHMTGLGLAARSGWNWQTIDWCA